MNPFKHPLCNFTYHAPASMPSCRDLECYRHDEGTTSFWRLDPGELNQLAAGGCIAFTHLGQGHPVIRLGIHGGEAPAHSSPKVPNVSISPDFKARLKRCIEFSHSKNPVAPALKQSLESGGESAANKLAGRTFEELSLALCFADILGSELEALLEAYVEHMEVAHPDLHSPSVQK